MWFQKIRDGHEIATTRFGGGLTQIIFSSHSFCTKNHIPREKKQVMLATPAQEDKDMEAHHDLATKW